MHLDRRRPLAPCRRHVHGGKRRYQGGGGAVAAGSSSSLRGSDEQAGQRPALNERIGVLEGRVGMGSGLSRDEVGCMLQGKSTRQEYNARVQRKSTTQEYNAAPSARPSRPTYLLALT
jgi:hypothetical protein